MGILTAPSLPSAVEIAGEEVPVRCGYRKQIEVDALRRDEGADLVAILGLCFGARSADGGLSLPGVVSSNAVEAVDAALEWHDGAWDLMGYGSGGSADPGPRRSVFDWEADSAIVAADFMRFYGIDLLSPSTQMHWYRFMALFLPLTVSGGAVSQAVSARSPSPAGSSKAERDRLRALARAWALPPTESELRAQAMGRF